MPSTFMNLVKWQEVNALGIYKFSFLDLGMVFFRKKRNIVRHFKKNDSNMSLLWIKQV